MYSMAGKIKQLIVNHTFHPIKTRETNFNQEQILLTWPADRTQKYMERYMIADILSAALWKRDI